MSHLTSEQRYTIAAMYCQGHSQKSIAAAIGKDKSVVCRELKRNSDGRNGAYRYELAQHKSDERKKDKPKHQRFTTAVEQYVQQGLARKLSPEQIVGVARKQGIACVSHERIYQYVWQDKRRHGILYTHLRTQGKRYRKRGQYKDKRGIIKNRVGIEQRPAVVEQRERPGDLEIDTIIGAGHQGAIVTINDRASGMLKMAKLESKDAAQLATAVIQLLQDWKPYLHTITSDNGKEFAAHQDISAALQADMFFAHPYHSWERGSNENLNGLIRQYIPKKTDFNNLSLEYIKWVEAQLNNRPRKRFNFDSPLEVFNQLTKNQKVAFIT